MPVPHSRSSLYHNVLVSHTAHSTRSSHHRLLTFVLTEMESHVRLARFKQQLICVCHLLEIEYGMFKQCNGYLDRYTILT